MQPHRGGGRRERLHALGQQPEHDAGEHIAAARRRQLRRRVRVDRGAAVGRGDRRCRRPSAAPPRRSAALRGAPARACCRPVSNRRANSPSCGVITQGERIAENSASGSSANEVSASASSTARLPARENRQRLVAGLAARHRRPARSARRCAAGRRATPRNASRPGDRLDDDPGQRRGIDRKRGFRAPRP